MNTVEKTLQYGTYYASRDDKGGFSIIRILTAGSYGIHYAVYSSGLKTKPVPSDIPAIPLIGHIPQDLRAIFLWDLIPLIHVDLTAEDLEGFLLYSEAQGINEIDIKHEIYSIIEFSKSGKTLTIKNQ